MQGRELFHLFELYVLGLAVVGTALCACIALSLLAGILLSTGSTLSLLLRVDVLRSGLPCGVQLGDGPVSYTHLTLPTNREV